MEHAQLKELLPLEALGRLEAEEARALEAHLRDGCDECEAELRDYRETLAAMALSGADTDSGERIWAKLERRLTSPDGAHPARRRSGVARGWRVATYAAAAAAIMLAVATGYFSSQLTSSQDRSARQIAVLEEQSQRLSAELTQRSRELVTLRRQIAAASDLRRIVLSPDVRLIKLGPLPPAPDAAGIVAVSASHDQALLQVAGLPAAPPEKAYELWWIGSRSGPVRAALFTPGAEGAATIASTMPPAGEKIVASAITLEPAGGVAKPTGAMYLKGAP